MSARKEKPSPSDPLKAARLSGVLDKSEQVHQKVEQAAIDLSSVNEVLKDEIAEGVSLATVELALDQNEAIEARIQESAEELLVVNDALAQEIDERHHLEERLSINSAELTASRVQERLSRHSAMHDSVTGLPNLILFNDRMSNALAQAQRHSRRLAVMFIDLDEFKSVNDKHGHDIGDRLLQMVAQRLQAIVREGDTVSRRGGDEFLILMQENQEQSNADDLAARIVSKIAEPYEIESVKLTLNASIGIALYPEDGLSAPELLKKADFAMYAAKNKRKDQPV